MGRQASSLPSLMIPCPSCLGRMSFRSTRQIQPEPNLQDIVYACADCGAELIRTAYGSPEPAKAA
jgi:hypothetical protein